MAEVLLQNVNKNFDEVYAVKDVNLSIRDKEFMVLVGPSGCGKTTTLRMVAGLESISSGRILIDDKVINDLPPMDRDIAMVFQNYALYPHMSVYDNMAFGLKMRKFDRADIAKRVQEAAEILGMQHLLKRKPRQLSGGQRQRVALGRAIVRHPQVFLFDEPLSNLDAKLRVQMRVELKKLHDRLGTTAIYVTHDQVEAMTLGDRVVVMSDGLVQQVGEPLELYNEPANRFVAGFLGSPAMNFATVTIRETDGAVWAEDDGIGIKVPGEIAGRLGRYAGKQVTMGIRPEDLHVATGADPAELGFDAAVEVVEKLGSEILLDVAVGSTPWWPRSSPSVRVNVHDRLRLALNPERLHFFDATVRSGDLIRGGAGDLGQVTTVICSSSEHADLRFKKNLRETGGRRARKWEVGACGRALDGCGSSDFSVCLPPRMRKRRRLRPPVRQFDGTYALVSSVKVTQTYRTRGGQMGVCADRVAGPLTIAQGQAQYTTATGYQLTRTGRAAGPAGDAIADATCAATATSHST